MRFFGKSLFSVCLGGIATVDEVIWRSRRIAFSIELLSKPESNRNGGRDRAVDDWYVTFEWPGQGAGIIKSRTACSCRGHKIHVSHDVAFH